MSQSRKAMWFCTLCVGLVLAGTAPVAAHGKLDVEGSELAFLRGAERMIRARRPSILFEINRDSARAGGYGVGDVLDKLSELGYDRAVELNRLSDAVPLATINHSPQRNVVAVHALSESWRRE